MRHDDNNGEEHAMGYTRRFSCTTSGDELLAIGQALRAAVGEHLLDRQRTSDGLRLRIGRHPQAGAALEEYARREQACCSFFDVAVIDDPEALSVTVSGPPEATALLDLLYQLAEPAAAPA